jgi:hypothetical protein
MCNEKKIAVLSEENKNTSTYSDSKEKKKEKDKKKTQQSLVIYCDNPQTQEPVLVENTPTVSQLTSIKER